MKYTHLRDFFLKQILKRMLAYILHMFVCINHSVVWKKLIVYIEKTTGWTQNHTVYSVLCTNAKKKIVRMLKYTVDKLICSYHVSIYLVDIVYYAIPTM